MIVPPHSIALCAAADRRFDAAAETARETVEATFKGFAGRDDVGLILISSPIADSIRCVKYVYVSWLLVLSWHRVVDACFTAAALRRLYLDVRLSLV